jgi:hypothetical protein
MTATAAKRRRDDDRRAEEAGADIRAVRYVRSVPCSVRTCGAGVLCYVAVQWAVAGRQCSGPEGNTPSHSEPPGAQRRVDST